MKSVDAATLTRRTTPATTSTRRPRWPTRSTSSGSGAFVSSYLKYLRVPVRRVLDVGCGVGLWRDIVAKHFPQASYHGVEVSEYLCRRYGWERGSVVDYQCPRALRLRHLPGRAGLPEPAST